MRYGAYENIEFDDIHHWDAPDYCDAYIAYAELNGVPLTDEQLDVLNEDRDFVYNALMKHLY